MISNKFFFAWKNFFIFVSIFVLTFAFCTGIWFLHWRYHGPEPSYPYTDQIRYSFTLRNTTGRPLKGAELWIPLPVKQTATQLVEKVQISHLFKILTDKYGNRDVYLVFPEIPPYGSKIVRVKANLHFSNSPNYLALKDNKAFLAPQTFCESDHPAIVKIADRLKRPYPTETAKEIFAWVAKNIRYSGYLGDARGALYALQHKKGDCTEFMYLFAALSRAAGVPARCMAGYILPQNGHITPAEYHNWVEFFDGKYWRIADAQKKVFDSNVPAYIAMQIICAAPNSKDQFSRFRSKGIGLKVKMNS